MIKNACILLFSIILSTVYAQIDFQQLPLRILKATAEQSDNVFVFAIDQSDFRSQRFARNMTAIASVLTRRFPDMIFCWVDADEAVSKDDILFSEFDLIEYPAALLFVKGIRIRVNVRLTDDLLVKFIQERLDRTVLETGSSLEINRLAGDTFAVIYFCTEEAGHIIMDGLAAKFYKHIFIKATSIEALGGFAKKYGVQLTYNEGFVVTALRHFDNTLLLLNWKGAKAVKQTIMTFIKDSARPSWTYFSPRTPSLLENTHKHLIYIIYDQNSTDDQARLDDLRRLSKTFYDDMQAVFMPHNDTTGRSYLRSMGLPVAKSKLFAVRRKGGVEMMKYVGRKSDLRSKEKIEEFVFSCFDGARARHYRSEVVEKAANFTGLKTVVGKSIESEIFRDRKNYHVVFLYDSYTIKEIPTFQKVSQMIKSDKIVYYALNSDLNEHEDIDPIHKGSIVIYSSRRGMNFEKAYTFDENLESKDLIDFIKICIGTDPAVKDLFDNYMQQDL